MLCPKCNNNVDESAVFCNNCGTPLKQNNHEIQNATNNAISSTPVQENVQPTQQSIEPTPVAAQTEKRKVDFKEVIKKNKIAIIIIIAVIALLIVIGFVVSFINSNNDSKKDPSISSAFFIKNEDGKYALFNNKGKQLSKFIYSDADEFYNRAAVVEDEDGNKGVINEKGKMVIDFGKYEYLYSQGGLFRATEKDYTYTLLDNKGKKLVKSASFDTNSFIGIDSFVILEYKDKEYVIYNYNGKKITSIKSSKDDDVKDPSVNEEGNFASVYYDGVTIIFNTKTAKVLAKIKEDKHYCVNDISEDEKIITLNSCVSWFESQDKTTYKFIKNNKVYDISDSCDSVYLEHDLLVCKKDSINYLLNKDYEPIEYSLSNMSYQDAKNYAVREDDGIEFIKNGKEVKRLEDVTLSDKGFITSAMYLTYKDGRYKFFDLNGELAFDTSFKRASNFDTNGLAKVSDDGDKYYYINTKGKKVSEDFDSAYQNKEFYTITNDSKKGIMGKNGKMLIECEYKSIDIRTYQEDNYYAYLTKEDKYELYDLQKKKVVLTTEKTMSFYDNYIKVSNNDKTSYYTYSGKLFYEE